MGELMLEKCNMQDAPQKRSEHTQKCHGYCNARHVRLSLKATLERERIIHVCTNTASLVTYLFPTSIQDVGFDDL